MGPYWGLCRGHFAVRKEELNKSAQCGSSPEPIYHRPLTFFSEPCHANDIEKLSDSGGLFRIPGLGALTVSA